MYLKLKCLGYDDDYDRLHVSLKQLEQNDYSAFQKANKLNSVVECQVIECSRNAVRVFASFDGLRVVGYIHHSQVSSLFFVDEKTAGFLFPEGRIYHCCVKQFRDDFNVVEFSRRDYLQEVYSHLEYGVSYDVSLVFRKCIFAYGNDIEGRVHNRVQREYRTRNIVQVFRR